MGIGWMDGLVGGGCLGGWVDGSVDILMPNRSLANVVVCLVRTRTFSDSLTMLRMNRQLGPSIYDVQTEEGGIKPRWTHAHKIKSH